MSFEYEEYPQEEELRQPRLIDQPGGVELLIRDANVSELAARNDLQMFLSHTIRTANLSSAVSAGVIYLGVSSTIARLKSFMRVIEPFKASALATETFIHFVVNVDSATGKNNFLDKLTQMTQIKRLEASQEERRGLLGRIFGRD